VLLKRHLKKRLLRAFKQEGGYQSTVAGLFGLLVERGTVVADMKRVLRAMLRANLLYT
jgi:hypothetical protein